MPTSSAEAIQAVLHDDGVLRITGSRSSRQYFLSGEIDASTYPALAASLNALSNDGDIHLDLSAVSFCDASGFGTMVSLADRVGPFHHVFLTGVPPVLCHLLRIVGWDSIPNLTVHQRNVAHLR